MKKRKHYNEIIAWAKGETIQRLSEDKEWEDVPRPSFNEGYEYRVKPRVCSINGIEFPEPIRELEWGETYFVVDITTPELFLKLEYEGRWLPDYWLSSGLCHSNEWAAKDHAKAILSATGAET